MISSMINFLYYENYDKACHFFEKILHFDKVMDQGFAAIFEVQQHAYIGVVKKTQGSIDTSQKGGQLISFNVDNVDTYFAYMKDKDVTITTDIINHTKVPLRSFFFTDEEGYQFEMQEFNDPKTKNKF